jgi:DNA-3-methyladenine glycosylase
MNMATRKVAGRGHKLERSFYQQEDVVVLAQRLLGKVLVTEIGGVRTSGIIMETEAYAGERDRASHAFGGRRTKRVEPMYGPGGHAYVYLCYGIHHLFNVVTNEAGVPHAVLVRGIVPVEGRSMMAARRAPAKPTTAGPGTLSQALGIHSRHSGIDLCGDTIWIEDRSIRVPSSAVIRGPRIGVDYAGADALLPYRFLVPPSQLPASP